MAHKKMMCTPAMQKIMAMFVVATLCSITGFAQTCEPSVCYTLANGDTTSIVSDAQSAPVQGMFKANPKNIGERSAIYEWRIYRQGEKLSDAFVHRYEENFEYTFETSGTFNIQLQAWFIEGTDTIAYPEVGEANPFTITISEAILEMPNAFSPNGDGINDLYKPVKHQSIVSFKASIFNRWGQKIYSWNDINGSWDGRVNGKYVKDGVYYINVTAKGADGYVFNIRQDINVLTSFTKEQ